MVELPEARFTVAALITILPFSVAVIDPLLVIVPVAFKVKVVPVELLIELVEDLLEALLAVPLAVLLAVLLAVFAAPEMDAPAATVRSPLTSIVTFEVAKAPDMADAVLASIVIFSGSKSHMPALPSLAETLTITDLAISKIPFELVSIKPPLPPKDPPWALKVPATRVFTDDQMLISPPLPLLVDDTSTTAKPSTVTVLARLAATILLRVPSIFWV